MTVAKNDVLTPTDLALEAYSRALEPKKLHMLPGGHFDAYSGPNFQQNASFQAQFLKETFAFPSCYQIFCVNYLLRTVV